MKSRDENHDLTPRTLDLGKPELVTIPPLLFALKTRSLAGTVVVGMLTYGGVTVLL